MTAAGGEHGTASAVEILPVTGLPEFRPGDDLGAAIAAAAPWLRDGDVAGGHQQGGVQVRGPAGGRARRSRGTRYVAAQACRRRSRPGAGPQGPHADHRERAGRGAGRGRCGRLQRRRDELALLPVDPDASAATLRAGLRERLGRHRRRRHHRHHGPRLAQRPDRRRGRRGRPGRAAQLRGCRRPARQRVVGHRGRDRRRDRRRGRSGQGQADRDTGGRRARAARRRRIRRRRHGAPPLRPGDRRPVLAGHRRSPGAGPPAGPAAAPLGAPVRRRAGAAAAHRGRRRGGAHRAGPAPHPAGPVRLAADTGDANAAAGPHERQVARRPGR